MASKKNRKNRRDKMALRLSLPSRNSNFKHKDMDSNGNVVMLKKRISDTNIINELLSPSSGLKLSLKEYRLLTRLRAVTTVTAAERKEITELLKTLTKF